MARPESSQSFSSQISVFLQQHMARGFGGFSRDEAWSPLVNIYQLPGRLEVCVELAGVDRQHLDVRVEPGRLVITGYRSAPEPRKPEESGHAWMRILAMEIDYGPFRRIIPLPDEIELDHVESAYKTGLLWITLPFKQQR